MSVTPLIAVIITNYNYKEFIRKAITSVIDQKHPMVEVIVVDDGSTDGSWSVISEFSKIKAVQVENGGQLKACIAGLCLTDAVFIMFLDADDELKAGSLNRIVEMLDKNVSKIQFALTRVDAGGQPLGSTGPKLKNYRQGQQLRKQVLRKGVYRSPPTSGNVFRRDVCGFLEEVDYDRSVDGAILYIAPFLGDVVSTSDELGLYRVHGRNLSNIGNQICAGHLREELRRFRGQMKHLSSVLKRLGAITNDHDYDREFVIQERLFQIAVAEGIRPSPRSVIRLIKLLLSEDMAVKNKLAIVVLCMFSLLLSRRRSKNMLDYRLMPGDRSLKGLIRSMIA